MPMAPKKIRHLSHEPGGLGIYHDLKEKTSGFLSERGFFPDVPLANFAHRVERSGSHYWGSSIPTNGAYLFRRSEQCISEIGSKFQRAYAKSDIYTMPNGE